MRLGCELELSEITRVIVERICDDLCSRGAEFVLNETFTFSIVCLVVVCLGKSSSVHGILVGVGSERVLKYIVLFAVIVLKAEDETLDDKKFIDTGGGRVDEGKLIDGLFEGEDDDFLHFSEADLLVVFVNIELVEDNNALVFDPSITDKLPVDFNVLGVILPLEVVRCVAGVEIVEDERVVEFETVEADGRLVVVDSIVDDDIVVGLVQICFVGEIVVVSLVFGVTKILIVIFVNRTVEGVVAL